MRRNNNWLRKCVMYYSLSEREKREFVCYEKERKLFAKLSKHELSARYVNTKARYEYKKNLSSLVLVTILVSGLINVWDIFRSFTENILQTVAVEQTYTEDIMYLGFILSLIIFAFAAILILILLVSNLKSLHFLHRSLLLMEEVRNSANN